ncbi:MAG TPA: hypothetical protein VHE61_15475 [Opitutaceae bacterium]|nr:hypothetical protein [Opitutaceae bacterium]
MNFLMRWGAPVFAGMILFQAAAARGATAEATLDQVSGPAVATGSGTWSFSGTATPGASVQVSILTSPATGPLPGPLTNRPVSADASGHWSQSVSQMTTPAGGYSFSATAIGADGTFGTPSPARNVTITAGNPGGGAVPVVADAMVQGTVGVAIAPVQLQVTGDASSFSAPELGAYGLSISSSGVVAGTPTMAITTEVDVTAANASGTSFPSHLNLAISAASTSVNATAASSATAAPSTQVAQTTSVAPAVSQTATASDAASLATTPATASSAAAVRLTNLSSRGFVSPATGPLVSGFIVSGAASEHVLIRGIGPALGAFGVAQPLADPRVTIYDASGAVVATNDNWDEAPAGQDATASAVVTAGASIGAFPLPSGSRDAAVVATLKPGTYTAVVDSTDGTSGTALLEVYELAN